MEKKRTWYYLVPLAGVIFGLWYLSIAFYDVIYSDYIRIVNSYLPDVWNPEKFLVPDVLTRMPVSYVMRAVNAVWFHYSVRFDQVMGILSLGLSAAAMAYYCVQKHIGCFWYLLLTALTFSLNKWEMMINGSGWVHFLAFAGFFYHYILWDRIWSGNEKKHDSWKMMALPWVLILGVAGPYCAVYVAVLILGYGFCMAVTLRKTGKLEKRYIAYGISVLLPFFCYLWSNAQVVPDWSGYQAAEGSIFQYLLDVPGYFVRFLLKSLCSTVVGGEAAGAVFTSNLPYMTIGLLVAAAYLMALWYQFRYRIYETTVFPLILLVSGGMNHLLVLWSRWSFLMEDYGMSSRYALQFQVGILGIFLTFAFVWKDRVRRDSVSDSGRPVLGQLRQILLVVMAVVFLAGNSYTTWRELKTAPYRKETCVRRAEIALDFENKTDDELRAAFEFRTSWPESGPMVRNALRILKEQNWNVFYGGKTK